MHKKPEPKTPLARLMDDRKISANALSRATGIPQPTISRIASGESKAPTDAKLRTIAAYLGVSVERLRGIEPAGTTGLIAREPTTSHSPLALDIATRWMSLSADRREFFRDLIFTMSFVEERFPAMRKGRPKGEKYQGFEAAIERDFKQLGFDFYNKDP